MSVTIRAAAEADHDAIWAMLEPMIRAGETYTLPCDMSREDALAYWFTPGHQVFVAELNGAVAGTYYLRANQRGGGDHVCNCGYVTAAWSAGRGVAGAMCRHSLEVAKDAGFRAMQFNFVVSTNEAAIHLWRKHGFRELTRLPGAFDHPKLGYVDALLMWREL